MKIKNNESLKEYTTIKIGGIAKNFYIPQNVDDLIDCLINIKAPYYLLGNGSNILINDKKTFFNVICLKEFNNTCIQKEDSNFYLGASLSIQQAINFVNECGYGGFEYLFSVPSLVGGAISMNAGRGKKFSESISDYILSVDVLDLESFKRITLKAEECCFAYRDSIFKQNPEKYLIIGGTFRFRIMSRKESEERKIARMKYVRKIQDSKGYNFGSVFSIQNKYLMYIMKIPIIRSCGACHFSSKTNNWLVNEGKGTYKQINTLINRAEKIHKFFGCKIKKEFVVWD